MQGQKSRARGNRIRELLESSNYFYGDLLGYSPTETLLQEVPRDEWTRTVSQRGFDQNSSGIFLPRNQTAIIPEGNSLSLFHEYFGHGLYCEQSQSGRQLVDLEKRLLEEEKREFEGRRFTLEEVKRFRSENKTFEELERLRESNLGNYELFAIWTEFLLSREFGLQDEFGRKYDSLDREDQETLGRVIDFNKQFGNLATFYAQGMARRTTPERAKKLLEYIYRDKLRDVRLALLYGSRKEFSDVDVFMVGEKPFDVTHDWVDVRYVSSVHFDYSLLVFDVAATDPIASGEVLMEKGFSSRELIDRLNSQPISEEAIYFNLIKSKEQAILAQNYPEGSKHRQVGEDYSKTYLANALALRDGRRIFTKQGLLSYLQQRAPAEGDKPLQVEGGRQKNAT